MKKDVSEHVAAARRILRGEKATPEEILNLSAALKKGNEFGYGRKLLGRALEDATIHTNPELKLRISQQYALCTYKDADLPVVARLDRALAILDDPDRQFAASVFLRLEVLPQAAFHKRQTEVAFYEAFFGAVGTWVTDLPAVTELALREASTCGVEAMDALHVAAAALAGASELVTAEKLARSIHRARPSRSSPSIPPSWLSASSRSWPPRDGRVPRGAGDARRWYFWCRRA